LYFVTKYDLFYVTEPVTIRKLENKKLVSEFEGVFREHYYNQKNTLDNSLLTSTNWLVKNVPQTKKSSWSWWWKLLLILLIITLIAIVVYFIYTKLQQRNKVGNDDIYRKQQEELIV